MRLEGKVALVAGAGNNMGRAIPVLFAQEGARQMLLTHNAEDLAETERQVRQRGGEVEAQQIDLQDYAAVQRAVARAIERFGGIDIVVNAAGGYAGPRPGEDPLEKDFFDAGLRNLVNTLAYVCQASYRALKQRGGGSIINIGAAPMTRYNGTPVYGVGKKGMLGFTESLARRAAADNIRVNTISPGRMRLALPEPPYDTAAITGVGPVATRFGSGLDVAYAAVYYASDESVWVTGSELVVDGGDAILAEMSQRK